MASGATSTYNFLTDNLGPLTTVFTGPTTCLSTTSYIGNGIAGYYVAAFWEDVPECYPQGTKSINLHTDLFYSPGICPSGWAPAVSLETDMRTTASDYSTYRLPDGVTAWLCCPSGYGPYEPLESSFWFFTGHCATTVRSGQTISPLWYTSAPVSSLTSAVATTSLFVLAVGIPVMWQSTDKVVVDWWSTASPINAAASSLGSASTIANLPSTVSSTSSDISSTTSDANSSPSSGTTTRSIAASTTDASTTTAGNIPSEVTVTVTAGPSSSSTTDTYQSAGGLSKGEQAGIGLGAGIFMISLLIVTYYVYRKRQVEFRLAQSQRSGPHYVPGPQELHAVPAPWAKPIWLGTHEMQTLANTHELPT